MEPAGRSGLGWGARLGVAALLVLVGAAAATWGLAHYQQAARLLGVVPGRQIQQQPPASGPTMQDGPSATSSGTLNPAIAEQIAKLQQRLLQVESENQQAQGSAGRADALLIAFAARRAVERGVALGYLEPLLVRRFGTDHRQAVATIVAGSRSPVRLTDLIAGYQDLEPQLVGPPPDEGFWTAVKRNLSSLVTVHRSDRPSSRPKSRYDIALAHLSAGEVDLALAETMRLPGGARAGDWIALARHYVAVHRALDEVESAALMGGSPTSRQ